MEKKRINRRFLWLFLGIIIALGGCKKEASSIAKIYVRTASNELAASSMVVIIADVTRNESTVSYVDTLYTNSSGYVEFNLNEYYQKVEKKIKTAIFDVICNDGLSEGTGIIRTRANTTAVETIKLAN